MVSDGMVERIAHLIDAEAFFEKASENDGFAFSDDELAGGFGLSVGDLRRARAALSQHQKGDGHGEK